MWRFSAQSGKMPYPFQFPFFNDEIISESPVSLEILGANCFYVCGSLSSVTFESESKFSRIEKKAFFLHRLKSWVRGASLAEDPRCSLARCSARPNRGHNSGLIRELPEIAPKFWSGLPLLNQTFQRLLRAATINFICSSGRKIMLLHSVPEFSFPTPMISFTSF
jgi:hypothetical protein